MENLTFEAIKNNRDLIKAFGSRDIITLFCTGCQVEVKKVKKELLQSLKKGKNGSFCSPKCSNTFYNKHKVFFLSCQVCNAEVRRTTSTLLNNAFCSSSCAATYNNKGKQRNKPIERTCKICDAVFHSSQGHESRVFCSECLDERNSSISTRADKQKHTCSKCSTEYYLIKNHKSKKLCQQCKSSRTIKQVHASSSQIKLMTLEDYISRESIKNKHPSWKFSHVRVFNRSWNNTLTKMPCQVCGYDKHVELAHIKAVSDFPETATLGEINDPDNMLVLCRNHHWELDHGILLLEDIPKRS
jgi:hypothetical protein